MTLEERKDFIKCYENLSDRQSHMSSEDYIKAEYWLDENEELYLECLDIVSRYNLRK